MPLGSDKGFQAYLSKLDIRGDKNVPVSSLSFGLGAYAMFDLEGILVTEEQTPPTLID